MGINLSMSELAGSDALIGLAVFAETVVLYGLKLSAKEYTCGAGIKI
jgi:hypothetical protein